MFVFFAPSLEKSFNQHLHYKDFLSTILTFLLLITLLLKLFWRKYSSSHTFSYKRSFKYDNTFFYLANQSAFDTVPLDVYFLGFIRFIKRWLHISTKLVLGPGTYNEYQKIKQQLEVEKHPGKYPGDPPRSFHTLSAAEQAQMEKKRLAGTHICIVWMTKSHLGQGVQERTK